MVTSMRERGPLYIYRTLLRGVLYRGPPSWGRGIDGDINIELNDEKERAHGKTDRDRRRTAPIVPHT